MTQLYKFGANLSTASSSASCAARENAASEHKRDPILQDGISLSSLDPSPGLVGFYNLGNTCFMNSALQCLSNTAPLTLYFLESQWRQHLNKGNPLGMGGAIATVYGQLVEKLWNPLAQPSRQLPSVVSPTQLKQTIASFNSIFDGYHQHDSQELLGSLLDGLHEDLNLIVKKPYVETPDSLDKSDLESAREFWESYKKRNDSVIVDLFQGQFKSLVECLECRYKSRAFDPFMFVSVPIPDRRTVTLEVVVFLPAAATPTLLRVNWAVTLKRNATVSQLFELASREFQLSLEDYDTHLAEVHAGTIYEIYPANKSLYAVKRDSQFALTFIEKDAEAVCVPVYQCRGEPSKSMFNANGRHLEPLGMPFAVALMCPTSYTTPAYLDSAPEEQLDNLKLLHMQLQVGVKLKEQIDTLLKGWLNFATAPKYSIRLRFPKHPSSLYDSRVGGGLSASGRMSFWLRHGYSSSFEEVVLYSDELDVEAVQKELTLFCESLGSHPRDVTLVNHPLISSGFQGVILLDFDSEYLQSFSADPLTSLSKRETEETETAEAGASSSKSLSLYDCLTEFTKQEALGKNDTWYCPKCKDHRQVKKKMDIYKAPDVLVFHLKRFSNQGDATSFRFLSADKLDVMVNAPQNGLDLSSIVLSEEQRASKEDLLYDLYAVSNHYGSMGSGHYTANARNPITKQWYSFDDSRVSQIESGSALTNAAYMLFYVRRGKHWFNEFEERYVGILNAACKRQTMGLTAVPNGLEVGSASSSTSMAAVLTTSVSTTESALPSPTLSLTSAGSLNNEKDSMSTNSQSDVDFDLQASDRPIGDKSVDIETSV